MNETHVLPTRKAVRQGIHIVLPTGESYPLTQELTIGASEHSDITVSDRTVSRRHAVLSPTVYGIHIRDQDSRNGTFLGDSKIVDAHVSVDSTVRLGAFVLRFREGEVEPDANTTIDHLGRFRGEAASLQPMYKHLTRGIASDSTILIEGESGTGKELLSEAVHQLSPRSEGPFVVVDCGSMPPSLVEAHLFGHIKGAFTGAHSSREGAFEQANGGTVFLDEVGELPLGLQTRLLRFLDRRQVRRVGSAEPISLDVRIVAATNRNLERAVEEGTFRVDLFHRLAVVYVRVPPLRERAEDLVPLSQHLVEKVGGQASDLTPDLIERIRDRSWPGNVRQLRNFLERWVLFGDALESQDPPEDAARANLPYRQARAQAIEQFTSTYVEQMLTRHDGNVSKAADAAGVARRYFQKLKARG